MKGVLPIVKSRIIKGEPIYTRARVEFASGETITLTPEQFRVSGNSYTTTGGNNFPIGKVLSKSITLRVSNLYNQWDAYDWRTATIILYSVIRNFSSTGDERINEGKFYSASVRYVQSAIEITAYDMLAQTDYGFVIRNVEPSTGAKIYDTIWDYFVYLCDTVIATKMGIQLDSNQHLYSLRLTTERFPNSDFLLDAIQPDSRSKTTLRDALGYIAQIAGGNALMKTVNYYPYYVIDIVPYSVLGKTDFYNAGEFDEDVTDIYDAGEFGEEVTDAYNSAFFSSMNYVLLDRYLTPPEIEYSDTTFTGVQLTYPVRSSDDGTAVYKTTDDNVMELYNPLCQVASNTATEQTRLRNTAFNIAARFCFKPFRPFEGSFLCNPLIEFGDNVVLIDAHGRAFQSFVSEHTLNYLGTSEISNNTKSDNRSNQVYYK